MIAPSYYAALLSILAAIFPDVPAGNLEVTINTIIQIAGAGLIMYRQIINQRATLGGLRP